MTATVFILSQEKIEVTEWCQQSDTRSSRQSEQNLWHVLLAPKKKKKATILRHNDITHECIRAWKEISNVSFFWGGGLHWLESTFRVDRWEGSLLCRQSPANSDLSLSLSHDNYELIRPPSDANENDVKSARAALQRVNVMSKDEVLRLATLWPVRRLADRTNWR